MSEVGSWSAVGEPSGPRVSSPAEATASFEAGALPIRLSVARGALGIELTRSLSLGAITVEGLELGLLGVKFPLDLSKGVKQFRNRRTQLERLTVRISFEALAESLRASASEIFGEPIVGVRVSALPEALGSEGRDAALALVVHSATKALAFEIVLISGSDSLFVLDRVRGVGLDVPAHELALQFVERLPHSFGTLNTPALSNESGVVRRGRAFRTRGVVPSVLLRVLPDMGFRLPALGQEVITECRLDAGELVLTFERLGNPLSLGRRGVRLQGASSLLTRADDFLAVGEREAARATYLSVLEAAPRQAETLLSLAELDAAVPGRIDVAQSFLSELMATDEAERLSTVLLLRGQLLVRGGRRELGVEKLEEAARRESDCVVAALLYLRLAELCAGERKREFLDLGVRVAPTLTSVRRARFLAAAEAGDLKQANLDAEHLAAGEAEGASGLASFVGFQFLKYGHFRDAAEWLSRALRKLPDSPTLKLALGRACVECNERLRGLSLLLSGLEEVPEREVLAREGASEGAPSDEELEAARLLACELLVSEVADLSQALVQVRRIETRGRFGAKARALEGRLAAALGDTEGRLRAHGRLLDALELGWLSPLGGLSSLLEIAESEARAGNNEMALRLSVLALDLTAGSEVRDSEVISIAALRSLRERLLEV